MRQVLSLALKQVVLDVGDLHGGGFAIINTIFTIFYGCFLQAFQTGMGWKRIKVSDIAKIYQREGSPADTMYNEVMRGLYYMHALSFFETHLNDIDAMDPQRLAIDLVFSFDVFLDTKLQTSIDEALRMNINF